MKSAVEVMEAAVRARPHSFDHIRKATGLSLTDEQFRVMVRGIGIGSSRSASSSETARGSRSARAAREWD